jgi:hypothetical protein
MANKKSQVFLIVSKEFPKKNMHAQAKNLAPAPYPAQIA